MKQIILILVGVGVIYFVGFGVFSTKSEVVVPEIQKSSTIKHPVREGNCWRQFTATDSILVCH